MTLGGEFPCPARLAAPVRPDTSMIPHIPRLLFAGLLLTQPLRAPGQVVLNEILYHAPDELDDLQFVELHNAGAEAVDLGGWAFTKGIRFRFPPGTRIEAKGFLVVCRNAARFQEFYRVPVAGVFDSKLSRKGERIELSDATGRPVDVVKFSDQSPWPQGADGHSGSLERICPAAPGLDPANWVSSPLSETRETPAGTPGKVNAGFSATVPPVVNRVTFSPEWPDPGQPIAVLAELREGQEVQVVDLLYRLIGPGYEKPEVRIPMKPAGVGRYLGEVPGQDAGQLLRFRVQATGSEGAVRSFPAETEPRPAFSAYVPAPLESVGIPQAWMVHTNEKEMKAAEAEPEVVGFGGPPPPDPAERAREDARRFLESGLDLSPLWLALTTDIAGSDPGVVERLKPVVLAKMGERPRWVESVLQNQNPPPGPGPAAEAVARFVDEAVQAAKAALGPAEAASLDRWLQGQREPEALLRRLVLRRVDIEAAWYAVTLNASIDAARWVALRTAVRSLLDQRRALVAEVPAGDPPDLARFGALRPQIEQLQESIAASFQPHLNPGQAAALEVWQQQPREVVLGRVAPPPRGPFPGPGGPPRGEGGPAFGGGGGPFRGGPGGPGPGFRFGGGPGRGGGPFGPPPSGPGGFGSALVYRDPTTQRTRLFDFIQINGRKGGRKVHLDRGQELDGMTTFALIFEGETEALVEPLAYEVYRRAGMAVETCYHVRLNVDGKPGGYSLLVEQPNRAFLRRNGVDDGGHMYKLLWYGGDLVGQHEKHTRKRQGHEDLIRLVEGLEKTTGDAQWRFIQDHFDVDQVATYFAVNMLLSHWDGFFNNYFTYHDSEGTGKWMMFPWDQDSTWGLRAFMGGDEVFHTMALTFGMNGDEPPADGGAWRPPGFFSGPLLANPGFRRVFLARTRDLLERVYTEEAFGPLITAMAERLAPEVRLRARLQNEDPGSAVARLNNDVARVRQHLRLRRAFLLAQPELREVRAAERLAR